MILKARIIINILDNLNTLVPGGQSWSQRLIEYKKEKERILMSRVLFGLSERGKELKELLKKRELAFRTGNPVVMIDEKLKEYSDLFFDPKLTVKLSFLESKSTLTDDDKAERDAIYAAQNAWRKSTDLRNLSEEVAKLVGAKKTVKSKIYKQVMENNFKNILEMSYLPKELKILNNIKDVSPDLIPTSIIRASIEMDKTKVTNEDVLKLTLVSLTCDKMTGAIKEHVWVIIYDLVEMEEMVGEDAMETLADNEVI